jgi:hypothetical protein
MGCAARARGENLEFPDCGRREVQKQNALTFLMGNLHQGKNNFRFYGIWNRNWTEHLGLCICFVISTDNFARLVVVNQKN